MEIDILKSEIIKMVSKVTDIELLDFVLKLLLHS